MAAANPAAVLGLDTRKGRLLPGYHADIVVLDRDLQVQRTYVAGELRFSR
jgi:N-acetylglucosamine-6-phosphate deacetylase